MNRSTVCALTLAFVAALVCSGNMCGQASAPPAAGTVRYWITATRKGQPVTDLRKEDLELSVGKHKQSICVLVFNPPEPLTVGLLIDTSASQRAKWLGPTMSLASGFFRQVILPGDQAFIMHFNDQLFVDARPSGDLSVLNQGLEGLARVHPVGGTALYDAIMAVCNHREPDRSGHRVLVLITDGEDDASRHPLDQAVAVAESTGTQIYIIGTGLDPPGNNSRVIRSVRVLRSMADATGGMFFLTSNEREMESGFNSVAEILRGQYALEFQPAGVLPGTEGNRIKIKCSRRDVKVVAPADY